MKKIFIAFIGMIVVLAACKKERPLSGPDRLFRPVLKTALQADGNWIAANWQPIKGAASYTVQLSRDSFKTIDVTTTIDTNYYLFQNLKWEQPYQVQVMANAQNANGNSKFSNLGGIKTPKFPTILNTPAGSESTENAVKVSWANSGAPVTSIKILNASDSSVARDIALSATDIANQYRIISSLKASTNYIIFLYSSATVRGWANFSTKAPLSGNLIDLREIVDRPSVLADTLPAIPSGSIVILKRGENYEIATTLSFSKSVTIMSGSDLLVPGQAVVTMPANFNIDPGSVIDSLAFIDVTLRGTGYSSKYVFNINTACTIGKMSFQSCTTEIFRGVVRTQSQPAIINNFVMNNCIIDSISGYGVLTVDVASSRVDNVSITNSTIYKAEKIVTSKSAATSVLIENCTINEAPFGGGGNYYVDFASLNVANGITINNSIFGVGKFNAGAQTVRGVRSGAGTSVNASNNYRTSDQVSLGNDIPNIITYTRPTDQLFTDPANGNFKIKDNTFPGRANAGDPRWRL